MGCLQSTARTPWLRFLDTLWIVGWKRGPQTSGRLSPPSTAGVQVCPPPSWSERLATCSFNCGAASHRKAMKVAVPFPSANPAEYQPSVLQDQCMPLSCGHKVFQNPVSCSVRYTAGQEWCRHCSVIPLAGFKGQRTFALLLFLLLPSLVLYYAIAVGLLHLLLLLPEA